MGTIGTIAAISVGGCLDNSSSGRSESDSGSNSGNNNEDSDTGQNNGFVDDLRSTYVSAIDHNKNARSSLQQALDEMNSNNLETADEHRDKAFTEFQDARGDMLNATVTAERVWDVDNEENLPEVHQNAVDVNLEGSNATVDIAANLDPHNDEKPDSDTIDEISTKLEQGGYTMPTIEEFEQELP